MKYIEYSYGNIPIIFTCPHNGHIHPSIEKRKNENSILSNDLNTRKITEKIIENIKNNLKLKPFYIINLVHRKYTDVNRNQYNCCEHTVSKEAWEIFHSKVSELIEYCKEKYGNCLLIDVHGNIKTYNLIEFGYGIDINSIDNREMADSSLKFLNKYYNSEELIIGDRSIANFIDNIESAPSPEISTKELIKTLAKDKYYYNGGFIIREYSSKYNIDTIQVEISRDLREKKNISFVSKNISDAIIKFYFKNYYPILKNFQDI